MFPNIATLFFWKDYKSRTFIIKYFESSCNSCSNSYSVHAYIKWGLTIVCRQGCCLNGWLTQLCTTCTCANHILYMKLVQSCLDNKLYTIQLLTVHNAVVDCTLYSVNCTQYSVNCILKVLTVHNAVVDCTLYSVNCTQYSVNCILYSVDCTQCSCWLHNIVLTVHYIVLTVHNAVVDYTI